MHKLDISALFPSAREIFIKKDSVVYDPQQDRTPKQVFYIESGLCRLKSLTYTGTTRTYSFLKGPRFLNYFPLVRRERFQPQYMDRWMTLLTCEACVDCKAWVISAQEFQHRLDKDGQLYHQITRQVMEDHTNLIQTFISTFEDSACMRLCKFLLSYAEDGMEVPVVRRFFTYRELAEYIGTHEVTVGKIMAKLQKYQYIEKCPHTIKLTNAAAIEWLIDHRVSVEGTVEPPI